VAEGIAPLKWKHHKIDLAAKRFGETPRPYPLKK
jgi:hypothetical protein